MGAGKPSVELTYNPIKHNSRRKQRLCADNPYEGGAADIFYYYG